MAGSNALARGVPRRLIQGDGPSVPVIGAGQIPEIQYSTGNARALKEFANNLFSLSNEFQDQLDAQASAEASSAGALAGASGDFQLQGYGTIRGRAFNKAAIETFAATMDTNSIMKLNELQSQFWNDPARLESEWGNYRRGVAQELAKVDPAAAIAFENRALIRGLPAVETAKDTVYKLTRSQADAALIENEAALRAEIKARSADLFSQNPERSRAAMNALSMVQNDFMRIYEATDPTTGKPLYTPEEIAKAKKSFADMTMTQATLSWFDEQEDKAGAYMRLMNGDFKFKVKASNDHVPIVMANKSATRNDPLKPDIQNRIRAAAAATGEGIGVVVHSGGQETLAEVKAGKGSRTGSVRHDHGGAADLRLTRDGKVIPMQGNRELYRKFAQNAAAAGLAGIGVDEAKGYIHAGGGSQAAWGYKGKSASRAYLPDDFASAIEAGRLNPIDPTPFDEEVPLVDMLSPSAMNGLDAELRSRITFMNTQRDRLEKQADEVLKAGQEAKTFDFMSRIYAAGAKDPETGATLTPPTREEIIDAQRRGLVTADQGNTIMKALTTEKPNVSDEPLKRSLLAKVYDGEDIYQEIIENGDKLSAADTADLLGKNQSLNRSKEGGFDADQKFYFDTLKMRLGQTGLMDRFDQGKQDRAAQAYDEFRRRVLDPNNTESPAAIADDIAARATNDMVALDQTALGRMVMPRFAVQVPGQYRIDARASALALKAAFDAGRISADQYAIEQKRILDWNEKQNAIDRANTAAGKTK